MTARDLYEANATDHPHVRWEALAPREQEGWEHAARAAGGVSATRHNTTPTDLTDDEREALCQAAWLAAPDRVTPGASHALYSAVERILAARDNNTAHEGWTMNGRPVEVTNGRLVEPGHTLCVHNVGLDRGLWCGGCTDALAAADRRADVRYQQGWADGYAAALSPAPIARAGSDFTTAENSDLHGPPREVRRG